MFFWTSSSHESKKSTYHPLFRFIFIDYSQLYYTEKIMSYCAIRSTSQRLKTVLIGFNRFSWRVITAFLTTRMNCYDFSLIFCAENQILQKNITFLTFFNWPRLRCLLYTPFYRYFEAKRILNKFDPVCLQQSLQIRKSFIYFLVVWDVQPGA